MSAEAFSFLETLTGAAQVPQGSASRPTKFGVIDPAYDPTLYPAVLPRVTYDGESALTDKRFAVIGSYWPIPGERVFMVPGGNTYVIVGPLPETVTMPGRARITDPVTGINAEQVILSCPFTFKGGWAYEVRIRGQVYGSSGLAQAHFRLRKHMASGAPNTWPDWGEYGRVPIKGPNIGDSYMANGSIFLLRTASTPLTATVDLTVARNNATSTDTVSVFASPASPAYIMIVPIGPAVMFAGFGVDVT